MTRGARPGPVHPLPTPDASPATRGATAVSPLVVPPAPALGHPTGEHPLTGQDWRQDAACAAVGVDPELFFPLEYRHERQVRPARRVCGRCPVRTACLADVLATEDPARRFGVCGGTTPQERSALFRAGLTVVPAASVAGGGAA